MTGQASIHPDFRDTPFWWEDCPPQDYPGDLPAAADVVVIGAGYCGLSAAHELAQGGAHVVVIDAQAIGGGASTRNGGQISGVNVGKGFSGARLSAEDDAGRRMRAMLAEAAEAMRYTEALIAELANPCQYARKGRFTGAWVPGHLAGMRARADLLNRYADAGARVVGRDEQHAEIGTEFYHGGLVVEAAGQLHPGLFHRALLVRAEAAGAVVLGRLPALAVEAKPGGRWSIRTHRGAVEAKAVVVATNGYADRSIPHLQRRIIPIASHIAATEELPEDLARSVSPRGRALGDSKRVLFYWRLTSDGRRILFGGRPRFTEIDARTSASLLHAAMVERFPQLRGTRMTHGWSGLTGFTFDFLPHIIRRAGLHMAFGCNGSGVAMMTWLGRRLADGVLSGPQDAISAFEAQDAPTRPLYSGKPWFLGPVGTWYRVRDSIDRLRG